MTSDSAFYENPYLSFVDRPANPSASAVQRVPIRTLHQYARDLIPIVARSHFEEQADAAVSESPSTAMPLVRRPRHAAARAVSEEAGSHLSATNSSATQHGAPLRPWVDQPQPQLDSSLLSCDSESDRWEPIEIQPHGERWEQELIERSSLADPAIAAIGNNVSDSEMNDVMRLLHFKEASEKYPLPNDAVEGSLEEWAISHSQYPETLMKAGRSYERQGFLYRAELCFKMAYIGGYFEAENALKMLPRDAGGNVIVPRREQDEIVPIDEEVVALVERGVKMARSGKYGQARLLLSLGLAIDGGL